MRIIAGTARGLKLLSLDSLDTRPTLDRVKEPLFSMLMPYLDGADVLDLFAGSGALGLEALSRGASKCTFVDKNPKCRAVIEGNIKKTRFDEKSVVKTEDFAKFLNSCTEKFSLVFFDPPYKAGVYKDCLNLLCENNLLQDGAVIALEADADEKFSENDFLKFSLLKERKYGRVKLYILQKTNLSQ